MDIENLSDEQIERARTCSGPAELIELAESEGVELTDDQLDRIAGGAVWGDEYDEETWCKNCGAQVSSFFHESKCPNCGATLEWQ